MPPLVNSFGGFVGMKKLTKEEVYNYCLEKYGKEYYDKIIFRDYVESIRGLVAQSFIRKGWKKNSKTYDIIGCSKKCLFNHIERQFIKGMSWSNRGDWHIDHIIPLAQAKSINDVIKLNHYTNLQPLWAKDNLKKSAKVPLICSI